MTAIFTLIVSAISISAATFTVTNTNDSGAGSLRDVINQANSNAQADTINFDPAFFNVARTITLTSGEINILPDGTNPGRLVTINGPGSNLLTISGGNASRIFLLGPQFNSNVTMNGMTLRDGNGISSLFDNGNGGAIYATVAANLTLNSMVIRNNVVTVAASGGGIYLNASNIVINDSLITENSAFNVGGIFSGNENRTFTMRNTTVSNNRSIPGDVGGISISRGTVDIKNCQITGNKADRSIGGMDVYQARMDITDTVISGNDSTASDRGGLKIENTSVVNLRRVTISNNLNGGLGVRNIGEAVNIIDSTISNNSVRDVVGFSGESGGGISIGGESNSPTRIINSTISGNSAPDHGGGIYNFSNGLQLINSTVVNNSVINPAGGTGPRGGGGIYDGELQRSGGSFGFRFKVQNSIIAGNTAATGPDIFSGFDSFGYNIIGNTANTNGSTANTGDQFNINPQVGALANNGGATQTHALLAGSPAINAGSNALAVDENGAPLRFDQRGACFKRIIGGTVDIGAFEFGASASCAKTRFDYDGDGRADISVFRPDNGVWYLNQSQNGFLGYAFGISTDKIIPADYDGDGKTDIAVFRPLNGVWYVQRSAQGFNAVAFGFGTDVPVAADYDGDGKADIAVFRDGTWYLQQTTNGFTAIAFGAATDKPTPNAFVP